MDLGKKPRAGMPTDDEVRRRYGLNIGALSNIDALRKKTQGKYFDSGDWVLSRTGKSNSIDTSNIGSEHPVPEKIPHLSSPVGRVQQHRHHSSLQMGQASSPVKETSFLSRETKPEDIETTHDEAAVKQQKPAAAADDGKLPIRN